MDIGILKVYPVMSLKRDYCYRGIKLTTLMRIYDSYSDPARNPRDCIAAYRKLDFSEIHGILYALEGKDLRADFTLLWDSFADALIKERCFPEKDRRVITNWARIHVPTEQRRRHVRPLITLLREDLN